MRARSVQAVWGIGLLVGGVWACETTRNPGGIQRDLTPPTLTLTNAAGDTQDIAGGLRFNVRATDNLGLKSIQLDFSGGHIGTTDTIFTSAVTTYNVGTNVVFPSGSGAGGLVRIIGIATDGAGNIARDTLFIFLANVSALRVFLITPATGAVASTGRGIPVEVVALQREGIRKIGFIVAPANAVTNPSGPPNDSLTFTPPYADSVRYVDTLIVVGTTGTFTVMGFAEDSTGRRGYSGLITVTIQSAVNDVTPPIVSHIITSRVEVSDSVTVHATDPSAISWMGIRITDAAGVQLRFDTINVSAGNLTDQLRKFSLNLGAIITTFPFSVVVRGYACDLATTRNCAFSQTSTLITGAPGIGAPMRAPGVDTVVVVAGLTRAFPLAGSQIVDAIFSANRNELYLTNPALSRLEIFQVANTSFVAAGIPTAGPQPWGIALWPRDTLGAYGDTVVVANSGGTQLAIIDVASRVLRWRQDLPNYTIQTYRVTQIGGGYQEIITSYDLSDRPQYVATVCRPFTGGGPACHSDSIFALYSTTPTPSQPSPFVGKGTVRMEKLINTTNAALMYGRFVWEISTSSNSVTADTLRILLHRRVNNVRISKVTLAACAGVIVELARMGLGDRTFARNSGNFLHAFLGEGGNVSSQFARVMSYDARDSLKQGSSTATLCGTGPIGFPFAVSDSGEQDVDFGMSPGIDVSDFISNTATRVRSIATNFNGRTLAVRADSIYYLGEDLRLKATSIVPAGDTNAVGMDMNYFHDFAPSGQCPPDTPACGGTGSPNDRLIFAARPDGNIDVFDTFFGAVIGSLPVRDPIIGPLRVARDATGQLLFGVTGRGLVTVRVPAYINPLPAPPRAGGGR